MLSRGERTLLRMNSGDAIAGWAAVGVEQLPNMRVMFVYELFAPHGHFEAFFDQLKEMAAAYGCSCAVRSQAPRKNGFIKTVRLQACLPSARGGNMNIEQLHAYADESAAAQ